MDFDFHTPTLDDKKSFDRILNGNDEFSSEYAFGTPYLWENAYNIQIFIRDDTIFRKYNGAYGFPYSLKDGEKALNDIVKHAKNTSDNVKFLGLTENKVKELEKFMPGKFKFEENRDLWDYVYNRKDLSELKGRKFHQKRNHISRFKKLYKWEYEDIKHENIGECKKIADKWFETATDDASQEKVALTKALDNYEELDLYGGVMKVDSEPVAFTIGEKINDKVFLVHFEKALVDIKGAYNVINNEFCKRLGEFNYINREEDLGIPGLRKAKMSYKPVMMVKKYTAIMEE